MNKILLYYLYTTIKDPDKVAQWQRNLCTRLNLSGRIILAQEGINGTVGGTIEQINAYKQAVLEYPLFTDIDFKENEGGAYNFAKLSIKVRNEIVTLGHNLTSITTRTTGTHLAPEQAHAMIKKGGNDFVLLDIRNKYEHRIGTFKGAIKASINRFKEFPAYLDKHLNEFKEKKVLMFCTGGIRCERASAYAKSKGIQNIYQIRGGIMRYTEKYPKGFFRGKNYVFDSRVALRITDDILSNCDLCQTRCDDYTNCINALCNKHFIACKICIDAYANTCSITCKKLVSNQQTSVRPFFCKAHNV